jgi:anaerobic ribonucleoside-triphosphate reductase activating protein
MQNQGLRYAEIIEGSFTDGPGGPRTVLFMQGCSIRCPGCQNPDLWSARGGTIEAPAAIAHRLMTSSDQITISGGEPTDQPTALLALLIEIRRLEDPDVPAHVIIYTGRKLEELIGSQHTIALGALFMADVVVDGPFDPSLDDDHVQWRGSRNQRAIDVTATLQRMLAQGSGVHNAPGGIGLYLVELDWDTPIIMFAPDGSAIGAAGLIEELTQEEEDASPRTVRRCGQTAT